MALIKCPECLQNVSDKAASCPQCGFPLSQKTEPCLPDTVQCLECKKIFPFNDHVCPHCGLFNSQKYALLEASKPSEAEPSRMEVSFVKPKQVPPPKKWYQTWKGLLLLLFILGLIGKAIDKTPSNSTPESVSKQEAIPYSSLPLDRVDNPKILSFIGWDMGKQIHEKYGIPSQQQTLMDYSKILNHKKTSVDRYIGKPVTRDDNNEYTYKVKCGSLKVGYIKGISRNLTVDFDIKFKGYVDVLRAVGINTLKRPFAANDSALIYNSNLGNGLINGADIIISLPNPSTSPDWRIAINLYK